MGFRDIAVSRGATIHNFRRSQLHIKPGFNIRDMSTDDNKAHVEDLANQIEARGFEGHIDIFMDEDRPTIWRGHCRAAAIDLLIERCVWNEREMLIPALLKPAGIGIVEMYGEQSRNGGSKALNVHENVANIIRIMGMVGQDHDRTAKLIGRSRSYVDHLLRFNEAATPEVHEAIAAGKISQTQSAAILRKEGSKKGSETIKKVVATAEASGKKKATKRDVEAAVKQNVHATGDRLIDRLDTYVTHPTELFPPLSIEAVKTAAIVLARDFLERVGFDFDDPATCKEAERIVAELNHALGKPMLRAAE